MEIGESGLEWVKVDGSGRKCAGVGGNMIRHNPLHKSSRHLISNVKISQMRSWFTVSETPRFFLHKEPKLA